MRRLVLVSGAVGVGKSEALKAMSRTLAQEAQVAVLETDQFYAMLDPEWSRPPDRLERYYEIAGRMLQRAARDLLGFGFDWVAIGSNGHWTEPKARQLLMPLAEHADRLHHVKLDPSEEILRIRIAGRPRPAWLVDTDEEVVSSALTMSHEVRAATGPWTHVLDSSQLSPDETARAIFQAVAQGRGRVR